MLRFKSFYVCISWPEAIRRPRGCAEVPGSHYWRNSLAPGISTASACVLLYNIKQTGTLDALRLVYATAEDTGIKPLISAAKRAFKGKTSLTCSVTRVGRHFNRHLLQAAQYLGRCRCGSLPAPALNDVTHDCARAPKQNLLIAADISCIAGTNQMYYPSDEGLNYSDTILVQTPSNNHLLGQQFCFLFVKSLFHAAQKQSKGSLRYFLWGESRHTFSK